MASAWYLLGKTCRLCLRCETLIADKAELDKLLSTVVTVSKPEYFVLGTADRRMYRRGLAGGASFNEVRTHTADFNLYWNVEITPAGWYPWSETGNRSAG